MDSYLKHYFNKMDSVVILSDPQTNEIVFLNAAARLHFNISSVPPGVKSYELLSLSGEDLEWYLTAKISENVTKFQTIFHDRCVDYEVVLESNILTVEDRLLRMDAFNSCDNDKVFDMVAYGSVFSAAVQRLQYLYKGAAYTEDNINDILDTVLYVYAADRVVIFEVDAEVRCAVDLYERQRKGFDGENEKYKDLDENTVSFLIDKLQQGLSYCAYTEEQENDVYRERMERNKVKRNMSAPFARRCGISCFLSVDNPRRYFGQFSFLVFASYMLASDMYTSKIQDRLDAAQRLSKRESGDSEYDLYVSLLGSFELRTSLGIVLDSGFSSSQCCTLFVFLLNNRKRIVSVREIADILWPDELVDNPYNLVKSVVFRTRKALEGVCTEPIIVSHNGTYAINKNLKIYLDVEKFERLCAQASVKSLEPQKRVLLYEQAMDIYRGGMLPSIEAEMWLLTKISYFQMLYADMVEKYIDLLREMGDYLGMLRTAARAMEIEQLSSDIHMTLIETLMANDHPELARKHFSKAERFLTPKQVMVFRKLWSER